MSGISTHVLDTALGAPARDLTVRLYLAQAGSEARELSSAATDEAGRVADLLGGAVLRAGVYRLRFETEAYFARTDQRGFYPEVEVCFRIEQPDEHYHVPLLLNPFGYTTYRGR